MHQRQQKISYQNKFPQSKKLRVISNQKWKKSNGLHIAPKQKPNKNTHITEKTKIKEHESQPKLGLNLGASNE